MLKGQGTGSGSVWEMIPHLHYAKSAQPVTNGSFGENHFDQTIEQFLTRMMKTSKGMTHAITVSTLTKWIHALPRCVPVSDALDQFTGMHTATSEQHKYLRPNTQSWENRNHGIFVQWLKAHPPFFGYEPDHLVSLSTGICADKSANCDNAVAMQ